MRGIILERVGNWERGSWAAVKGLREREWAEESEGVECLAFWVGGKSVNNCPESFFYCFFCLNLLLFTISILTAVKSEYLSVFPCLCIFSFVSVCLLLLFDIHVCSLSGPSVFLRISGCSCSPPPFIFPLLRLPLPSFRPRHTASQSFSLSTPRRRSFRVLCSRWSQWTLYFLGGHSYATCVLP